MRKLTWLWFVVLACSCGNAPTPACIPGERRACACGYGLTETCRSDGTGYYGCASACEAAELKAERARICAERDAACDASPDAPPSSLPCSPSDLTGSCPADQTCVSGSCCPMTRACGAACCTEGAVCVTDASGNRSCAQRCDTNTECPGMIGMRCCRTLYDSETRAPLDYGACGVFVSGVTSCRCAVGADCGSGSCTPSLSRDSVPTLPYVCTAPVCAPYQRCDGFGSCPNGYCNMCDARGNCFCAQVCTSDAMCGTTAQCGTLARSIGSCSSAQRVCIPR